MLLTLSQEECCFFDVQMIFGDHWSENNDLYLKQIKILHQDEKLKKPSLVLTNTKKLKKW